MARFRVEHDFDAGFLSNKRFSGLMLSGLRAFVPDVLAYFELTTQTFESFSVDFTPKVYFAGGVAAIEVTTDNDIWNWLDEGTFTRWAVMNSPFESKTSPREIASGVGLRTYNRAGYYTSIRGRKAMQERNIPPRPGIEGRDWTTQIADEVEDKFVEEVERIVDNWLFESEF